MGIIVALVMLLVFLILVNRANHIPKTGRAIDVKGEVITAIITNENKNAERAVWLRAKDRSGRKYKVKMKASEAKLWLKGDEIKILVSKTEPKKYRVQFNDYFRENDSRIREAAINRLETKIKKRFAARFVGYSEKTLRAFKMCSVDTHNIFVFTTFMRMIDFYSIIIIAMVVSFFFWFVTTAPSMGVMFIPLIALLFALLLFKGTIDLCKRIKADVIKSAKENKAKMLAKEEAED